MGEQLGMKPEDNGIRIQLALLMKGVVDEDSDELNVITIHPLPVLPENLSLQRSSLYSIWLN